MIHLYCREKEEVRVVHKRTRNIFTGFAHKAYGRDALDAKLAEDWGIALFALNRRNRNKTKDMRKIYGNN